MINKKIVINRCFGGFGLSHKAILRYAEIKGFKLYYEEPKYSFTSYYKVPKKQYDEMSNRCYKEDGNYKRINELDWYFSSNDLARDDTILIQVVEELGKEANGQCADLSIIEIPSDVEWEIDEYDGMEKIVESGRREWNQKMTTIKRKWLNIITFKDILGGFLFYFIILITLLEILK